MTTAMRILNVITDILTLLALAIAGVGHFLPWTDIQVEKRVPRGEVRLEIPDELAEVSPAGLDQQPSPLEFQGWHVVRSGTALGLAAVLVGVSLVMDPRARARKLLVFLMFAAVLTALVFQVMIYSPYPFSEVHRSFQGASIRELQGYYLALIPTIIAGALTLVRMGWTMIIPSRAKGSGAD